MINATDFLRDSIIRTAKLSSQLIKLNAIWIEGGIRVFNKYNDPKVKLTYRISKGYILSLDGDKLADYNTGDNYEIVECLGTIDSSVLKVELKSVETGETKTITIN